MEYRIGDKKVRIHTQYLERINGGDEGIVYKYKGKCLKLYHDKPKKSVLSLRDCDYMTKLSTKRVLLPQIVVCDKKHIIHGYITSPYIEGQMNIYEMRGEDFLFEREAVSDELIYLGENFVSVDDFWLENFKYNGKFYLLDPGSYSVQWNMLYIKDESGSIALANYNLECFNAFLVIYIIFRYVKKVVRDETTYNDIFNEVHQRYLLSTYDNKMDYISQFIIPDAPLKESIKELIKCHKI